jgi:hypothetical protein
MGDVKGSGKQLLSEEIDLGIGENPLHLAGRLEKYHTH